MQQTCAPWGDSRGSCIFREEAELNIEQGLKNMNVNFACDWLQMEQSNAFIFHALVTVLRKKKIVVEEKEPVCLQILLNQTTVQLY